MPAVFLPWRYVPNGPGVTIDDGYILVDAAGVTRAFVDEETTAKFIIDAVNAYHPKS